jgi:hypothetical protein
MTPHPPEHDLNAEMLALRASTEPSDRAFLEWFAACIATRTTTADQRELLRQRMNSATDEVFSRLLHVAADLPGKSWQIPQP